MEDEKELFANQFYEITKMIETKYNKSDYNSKEMLGHVINNYLASIKLDINTMGFKDFYLKYLQGTLFLGYEDFTNSEIEHIISESKLNDDDKELAKMFFVKDLNCEQIHTKTGMHKKTIKEHLCDISLELKKCSSKKIKEMNKN